jgi:hypothetical protein
VIYVLEFITEALFVFWFCGTFSVLLDVDHIWFRLGRAEPFNFTNWPGRCFHHPIVFLLCSIVVGCFVFAPVYGYYVWISGQVGTLATLLGECGIITGTIISLKWFDKRNKGFLDERKN